MIIYHSEIERENILEKDIKEILSQSVSDNYIDYILYYNENGILSEIVSDIKETSNYIEGDYNREDIKLAIGRVLINRLNIDSVI